MDHSLPESIHRLAHEVSLGNHDAFKELYLLCYPRLFSIAMHVLRSEPASEEVISDVFFNLWKKKHLFGKVKNPEAYLCVSVKNTSLNKLKEPALRYAAGSFADIHVELLSGAKNPEDKLIEQEIGQTIRHVIEQLPPQCRLIFKLAKEEGRTYREISELLGISVRTVNAQLTMAGKKLRCVLKNNL